MAIDAVTPDLIYPVLLMVGMYLIIGYVERLLPIILISALFLPIAWIFTYQMYGSEYLFFCNADITAYTGRLPGFNELMSLIMWFVPVTGFMKIIYIKKMISSNEQEDNDDLL